MLVNGMGRGAVVACFLGVLRKTVQHIRYDDHLEVMLSSEYQDGHDGFLP